MHKPNKGNTDLSVQIFKTTLEPENRLDAFLAQKFADKFSRSKIQELIKTDNVLVNGKVCNKASFKTDTPAVVEIHSREEQEYVLTANEETTVPVLYEDSYLAIIHKPAGMTVHPGAGTGQDTLVHSLLNQINELSEGSEPLRPGIVHRLDRDTEGLMVIAKKNNVHRLLSDMFSERIVKKEYHAWVWGKPQPEEDTINGYISRNPVMRKKMIFTQEPLDALSKEASLSYKILESGKIFSFLQIDLHTGRTHQIRATFSAMGIPVVGDDLYSRFARRLSKCALSEEKTESLIKRGLLLIASRLSFMHPVSNKIIDYTLPLPERFFNLE